MSEIVLGVICTYFWCFVNGRMQFSKWPRPNFRSQNTIYFKAGNRFQVFKSPHLATLIIIWHKWEDRSRKVSMEEPDLRFCHGNFWPFISHSVRKPCFSTSIPRGPNPLHLNFYWLSIALYHRWKVFLEWFGTAWHAKIWHGTWNHDMAGHGMGPPCTQQQGRAWYYNQKT